MKLRDGGQEMNKTVLRSKIDEEFGCIYPKILMSNVIKLTLMTIAECKCGHLVCVINKYDIGEYTDINALRECLDSFKSTVKETVDKYVPQDGNCVGLNGNEIWECKIIEDE